MTNEAFIMNKYTLEHYKNKITAMRPYCFCILKKPIDKNILLININNIALKEFP